MQRAEARKAEANVRRRGMAAPTGGGSRTCDNASRAAAYLASFTKSLKTLRTFVSFGAATALQ